MKVMITGAAGQLGQALLRVVPASIAGAPLELIISTRSGGQGAIALDLADAGACRTLVEQFKPHWLINAGAYTAVDKAESEVEQAHAVNAGAPAAFGEALQVTGGRLLQLSTDFVFNGAQGSPYTSDQPVNPLGVYGASKAAGETAAAAAIDLERLCILRTSWVYSPWGTNFLLTMLRLMAKQDHLGVVADQVSCPTSALGLAQACWAILEHSVTGIHHWSDAGVASWYDFAVAIAEIGEAEGLLVDPAAINPITSAEYRTSALRPHYSVLGHSKIWHQLRLPTMHWRQALKNTIRELRCIS